LLQKVGLADKVAEKDQAIHSVAVLPFQNIGGDPKTEFLSDGVADQIINSLSQLHRQDLKVRPFTSVARYKGKELDVPAFGRELNVRMIVTGTLRQQGDGLAISVAVVDVQEEAQLWGHTYRGKRDTILDLQDQIARDVAANLRLRLTGEEEHRLTKRYTEDPEIYFLYREGVYHYSKLVLEEVQRGKEYFERALKKDPNYVPALMGMAIADIRLGSFILGPRQTYPQARELLTRVLALDDTLADAHFGLAIVYQTHDWDWPAAEREAKRAFDLGSHQPAYGFWLAAHGRLPEALAALKRGQELDPATAPRRLELAMCYNWMRQSDRAIAEAQKAIELDGRLAPAYGAIGLAHAQKGNYDQAIEVLRKGMEFGGFPQARGMLGYVYAVAGKKGQAQKVLQELKAAPKRQFGDAFALARIHAALDEKDQAFEWLQKACDERNPNVIWLKVDPTMDNVRSDPRFAQVLKDMGLPP
jgi:TolB-like protein/Tfp pilus assembly protein PilF